jgi:hypothetical protein
MFLLNVSFNTFDRLNDHLRDTVKKRLFPNDKKSVKRQFKGTGSPDEYFEGLENLIITLCPCHIEKKNKYKDFACFHEKPYQL